MPSVSSSSSLKVLLSSTVMTPSLPTLSMASAISSPMVGSAAEIEAVAAICSLVSTSLAVFSSCWETASTAFSIPRLSAIGFAPAATLRRPSRTSAWASTVAVVVPSPAMSSVFLATSLTSSAPIFSQGSSSSISLAMLTPSLVMVGAPHFFSRTTLRPRGPSVTLTASARVFMPRSSPRRASSSKAIIFAMGVLSSDWDDTKVVVSGGARDGRPATLRRPHRPDIWHSTLPSASPCLALGGVECNARGSVGGPHTTKGAGVVPAPFAAPCRGPRGTVRWRRPVGVLDPADGVGLAAAVASRRGLELHAVAFLQRPEPVHLDRAVVHEDVGSAVGGDEAEPLLRVEPLDRALSHGTSMLHVLRSDASTLPQRGLGTPGRA